MLYPTLLVKFRAPYCFDQCLFKRKTNAMRPAALTIHLGHLALNYRLLRTCALPSEIMAVIKANAYGHGLLDVADALMQEGCKTFAVTDATEGVLLRQHTHQDINIILLSGIFDAEDACLCKTYQLIPVLSQIEQLNYLKSTHYAGHIWLKVDTGMSRIGVASLGDFVTQIQDYPFHIAGIMSHLACADTPEAPLNRMQLDAFRQLQQTTNFPAYSLLNSAGLIGLSSQINTDIVRPGIALYGDEPIPSQPLGLKPVMQLSSKIIQLRPIKKGQGVSYGATWIAPTDMQIAVVAMGYADGLPRLLSNQGEVLHKSGRLPIVGRICMDYCLLAVTTNTVQTGDEVIFFGYTQHAPTATEVAQQCQTISYELFTGMQSRLTRQYLKGVKDESGKH